MTIAAPGQRIVLVRSTNSGLQVGARGTLMSEYPSAPPPAKLWNVCWDSTGNQQWTVEVSQFVIEADLGGTPSGSGGSTSFVIGDRVVMGSSGGTIPNGTMGTIWASDRNTSMLSHEVFVVFDSYPGYNPPTTIGWVIQEKTLTLVASGVQLKKMGPYQPKVGERVKVASSRVSGNAPVWSSKFGKEGTVDSIWSSSICYVLLDDGTKIDVYSDQLIFIAPAATTPPAVSTYQGRPPSLYVAKKGDRVRLYKFRFSGNQGVYERRAGQIATVIKVTGAGSKDICYIKFDDSAEEFDVWTDQLELDTNTITVRMSLPSASVPAKTNHFCECGAWAEKIPDYGIGHYQFCRAHHSKSKKTA